MCQILKVSSGIDRAALRRLASEPQDHRRREKKGEGTDDTLE